jgi:hypothetical protein
LALSIRGKGVVAGPSGSDGRPTVPLAAGNLTTAAGSGLPLPRSELILAGKSIVRSMRRVTHGAGPRGKGDANADQLMGDAARIGALASILDPAGGLVSLATAGAGAGSEAAEPQDVLECLRLHLGQLGYMQGVLDENVCQVDGQLGGLDGLPEGAPARHAPETPADPASLSDEELRAVRSAWAARADVDFDAVIGAQQAMNDLDNRRRNLDHQVDALSDLLARLDDAGTTPVPRHLGDTLCYGLGWHLAGDSQRMASALRESLSQARASSMAAASKTPASPTSTASSTAQPGPVPSRPAGVPFADWAAANKVEGGRLAILQALAGLQRWCGFYDALTGTLQRQLVELRVQADTTSATRRALSAELQRRALLG